MAEVYAPIAKDESFNTTEQTPRNLADVLAQALQILNTTISGLNFINCVVVQTLPTTGISTTTIYLVPKNPAQTDNLYDEYINLTGTSAGWEKIGDTEIDLSDYYNKTETDTLLSGKVDKVNGKGLSTNDYTTAEKTKLAGIEAGAEVNPTSGVKTATESFETVDGGLLSKCMIDLVPVQSGSGDPSPDNIRPISGHTEVDLYNVGKNKLDPNSTIYNAYIDGITGIITSSSTDRTIVMKVNPSSNYVFTWNRNTISSTDNCRVSCYSELPIVGTTSGDLKGTLTESGSLTFNTNNNESWIAIKIGTTTKTDVTKTIIASMLEEGSTATPYEPYLGHLYQVQIGQTVYGGSVDLVSGVMTAIFGYGEFDGSNDETISVVDSGKRIRIVINGAKGIPPSIVSKCVSNLFKTVTNDATYIGNVIGISQDTDKVFISDGTKSMTSSAFRTFLSSNPLQVCYELATPFTIQLTPQQIEALAGQNNLSTPLSGQSIETNGVEYKELFTFADVKEYVKPLIPYSNAGSHNAIYRGKYLGDHVTPEQWASIVAGTFDDLFIGDYWIINSVTWRIAHFNYWLGTGDTECTTPHVVIAPDTNLYNATMNSTDITTGGYYNSEMRGGANYLVQNSSGLYDAKVAIDNAFGSSHILTHREILTKAVSSGNASGWDWYDSSVDLMNEVMVYGTLAWSNGGKGYEVGDGKGQLALFRHDISKVTNRAGWWLRGVRSATDFARVNSGGNVAYASASASNGVRPCFAIK